jgi:hypothetical protein
MPGLSINPIGKSPITPVSFIGEASTPNKQSSVAKDSLTKKESGCLEDTKAFFASMGKAFVSGAKAVWDWILENVFCRKEPLEKRAQKAEEAVVKSQEEWRLAREKFEKSAKESDKKSDSYLDKFGSAKIIQNELEQTHTKNGIYSLIDHSNFSKMEKAHYKKTYDESPVRLYKLMKVYVLTGEFLIGEKEAIAYFDFLSLTPPPTAFEASVAFSHLLPSTKEKLIRVVGAKEEKVRNREDFLKFLSSKDGLDRVIAIYKSYGLERMKEIENT